MKSRRLAPSLIPLFAMWVLSTFDASPAAGQSAPSDGRPIPADSGPPSPAPPPSPFPAPAPPSPPTLDVYRAIPDVEQQRAQREAVQDIGQAQTDLRTSARELGASASVASIKRLQARAVRLANQAAHLQISDTIASSSVDVLPELRPLLEMRAQAIQLRSTIQAEAQEVKSADPARDAERVNDLIAHLETDVAALRDVTRDADQQLDRLRAIYVSSASLVVSGGVSLGSYQGGFLHYYTQYLLTHGRYVRKVFGGDGNASPDLDLVGGFKLVTGASAGSINGFLAAIAGCRKPIADPEQSLFYRTWIPVGINQLVDAHQVEVDGILSRQPIERAVAMIKNLWTDGAAWDACNAYLGISATRLRARMLKFPEKVADRIDDAAPSTGLTRLTEKFVLHVSGPAARAPRFSALRPHTRDPKAEPPAELYPTLGAVGPAQLGTLDDLPAELEQVMTLLEASSSFPFAFPPMTLPITVWHQRQAMPLLAGHTAGTAAPATPATATVFEATREPNAQFIDGGVFDNTPLGLAIHMGEWMPHAPARYLFLVSGNIAWQPAAVVPMPMPTPALAPSAPPSSSSTPSSDRKPQHPGTTFEAYGPFATDFLAAAEDTELMNTVEGHGDVNRELPARQMPIAGDQLGHFLAFFEKDFRVFDFFMGMVDAHEHIATHNPEQLAMLERAGASLTVQSPTFACFLDHRRKADTIAYQDIAALPACRGQDANLIALLQASTQIKRQAQARQPVADPLQQYFQTLDAFHYRFRDLQYRGSPATGATAKLAIRDLMQELAHDLSAKQDGESNKFVVSVGSKAASNLFLYRPPSFYLGVGLDTDAGGQLEQGIELGRLPFASRPALRLTLGERAREFDRSKLDPAVDKFTYTSTLMGAAHLVLELPLSNVFQLEVGAGASILERIGLWRAPLMWRWGPEAMVRLVLLQRFYLGASLVYYLDDCAGNNHCDRVPARFQSTPSAISTSGGKFWLSVGTRFFWFN